MSTVWWSSLAGRCQLKWLDFSGLAVGKPTVSTTITTAAASQTEEELESKEGSGAEDGAGEFIGWTKSLDSRIQGPVRRHCRKRG